VTVATQPAHDIRPDKAATANYDYFHVVVLNALSISVVLIEGFQHADLAAGKPCRDLGFPLDCAWIFILGL